MEKERPVQFACRTTASALPVHAGKPGAAHATPMKSTSSRILKADPSASPACTSTTSARPWVWLRRMLAAGLLVLLGAAPALAQILPRDFPKDAQAGQIRHVFELTLSIDGRNVAMAPGGMIRDRNNLIIVPASLPAGGAIGRYLLDENGRILRVWLLTDQEIAQGRISTGNWNR